MEIYADSSPCLELIVHMPKHLRFIGRYNSPCTGAETDLDLGFSMDISQISKIQCGMHRKVVVYLWNMIIIWEWIFFQRLISFVELSHLILSMDHASSRFCSTKSFTFTWKYQSSQCRSFEVELSVSQSQHMHNLLPPLYFQRIKGR